MDSLRACSLACTAILELAPRCLFFDVDVDNVDGGKPGEKPPANRFKSLMDSDPSIAEYVRKFRYVEFLNSDHDRLRWPVLRNANVLGFGFDYYGNSIPEDFGRQAGGTIGVSLRTSFDAFMSSTNCLLQLAIWNISFPLPLLQKMPHLICLEIYNVVFVEAANWGPFPKTKLKHLFIRDTGNVLEDLKFRMSLERHARCKVDREDWGKLDNILSRSSGFPFLRRVEITVVLGEGDIIHDTYDGGRAPRYWSNPVPIAQELRWLDLFYLKLSGEIYH